MYAFKEIVFEKYRFPGCYKNCEKRILSRSIHFVSFYMRCFQCHVHLHFGPLLSFWTVGSTTVFGRLRAVLTLGCLGPFLMFECFRSFFVSIGVWISLFGRVCKQPTLSGSSISAFLRRLHWQLTYHRVRKCCAVFLDVSQKNGSNSAPHVNDQVKVNTVQNSCQKCVLFPRGITMSVAWLSQLLVQPSHRASWPHEPREYFLPKF